jgi:2-hydroxychromene-2-carboxylate isomerase
MYNSAGDAAAEIPGDIRSDSIARAARRHGLEFRQKFSFTTEYTMRDSR